MQLPQKIMVFNHQEVIVISDELIDLLESSAVRALPYVLKAARTVGSVLTNLQEVEVSLVDDATIADVHVRFMDIAGATDVITFDHGEIHISVETAREQAEEFDNNFERELMLYIIHGLLHLAGHEDATPEGLAQMNDLQQSILGQVWGG